MNTTTELTFDEKVRKLQSLGFASNRVGMDDGKYSFLWHQIDELSTKGFNEFINDITKTN